MGVSEQAIGRGWWRLARAKGQAAATPIGRRARSERKRPGVDPQQAEREINRYAARAFDLDSQNKALNEQINGLTTALADRDQRIAAVFELHQRQPVRHVVPCEAHANATSAKVALSVIGCPDCALTVEYHCSYDSHGDCGYGDYPCRTVRLLTDSEGDAG